MGFVDGVVVVVAGAGGGGVEDGKRGLFGGTLQSSPGYPLFPILSVSIFHYPSRE